MNLAPRAFWLLFLLPSNYDNLTCDNLYNLTFPSWPGLFQLLAFTDLLSLMCLGLQNTATFANKNYTKKGPGQFLKQSLRREDKILHLRSILAFTFLIIAAFFSPQYLPSNSNNSATKNHNKTLLNNKIQNPARVISRDKCEKALLEHRLFMLQLRQGWFWSVYTHSNIWTVTQWGRVGFYIFISNESFQL